MKIIVIDDKQKHLDAAIQTLIGHDVTICSTYDDALELLEGQYWDAVLCDLLMPAGRDAQGPKGKKYVGKEMPVGWSLALFAARRGAKYVAVISDMNHHDHPASAMIDRIGTVYVNTAKVAFLNDPPMVGIIGSECVCPTCKGTLRHNLRWDDKESDCTCKTGTSFSKWGKDWGIVLKELIGGGD